MFRIKKGEKYFTNIWIIHLKQNTENDDQQVVYCDEKKCVHSVEFPKECILEVNVGGKWIKVQ